MRNHKKSLAKQLKQVAEETNRLAKATAKNTRKQRQQDRRERYRAQSPEGPHEGPDHRTGGSTPRPGGSGQESAGAGHVREEDRQEQDQEGQKGEGEVTERPHDLGRGCWCAPIIIHVPPAGVTGPMVVDLIRDADRLARLGITDVEVRFPPDVPPQRG